MYALPPTISIVTQPTRLASLKGRWSTRSAAKFRVKQAIIDEYMQRVPAKKKRSRRMSSPEAVDAAELAETNEIRAIEEAAETAFADYESEDAAQHQSLDRLKKELDIGYPLKFVERQYLPTFDFRGCVAVVIVGQDGLVANAAKYVGDIPIIAVNPDPKRIDGVLLPFQVHQARAVLQRTIKNNAEIRPITLAEVKLNDGQRMLAFNDFFIGCNSHASAKYTLHVDNRAERQSSSGMIVSTGAGSTGWLSSVFNMADGFAARNGSRQGKNNRLAMSWEDRRLVWVVREPFLSKCSGVELVLGELEQGKELIVESLMPAGGVIFSDGVENDFLEFTSGSIAHIFVASQRAKLVVG
jgi:NAD kinase